MIVTIIVAVFFTLPFVETPNAGRGGTVVAELAAPASPFEAVRVVSRYDALRAWGYRTKLTVEVRSGGAWYASELGAEDRGSGELRKLSIWELRQEEGFLVVKLHETRTTNDAQMDVGDAWVLVGVGASGKPSRVAVDDDRRGSNAPPAKALELRAVPPHGVEIVAGADLCDRWLWFSTDAMSVLPLELCHNRPYVFP